MLRLEISTDGCGQNQQHSAQRGNRPSEAMPTDQASLERVVPQFAGGLLFRGTIGFSRRRKFTIDRPLPPPPGYPSWLEYAVETFDTREPWLESHFETWFNGSSVELNRQDIRDSARLELQALRQAARKPLA